MVNKTELMSFLQRVLFLDTPPLCKGRLGGVECSVDSVFYPPQPSLTKGGSATGAFRANRVLLAGNTGGGDDRKTFYQKFDNGKFDNMDPLVKDVRPDNCRSVEDLFATVKKDKGEEYATKVVKAYYVDYLKRTPLTWDSLDLYQKITESLGQSNNKLLLAIRDFIGQQVQKFVQENISTCPENYKKTCEEVDQKDSLLGKAWYHFQTGGMERLKQKVACKLENVLGEKGADGVAEQYKTGELKLEAMNGALAGYSIEEVFIKDAKVAVVILGDRAKGARVDMRIAAGGGVTVEGLEADFPENLQYQGPAAFQHGEKLPQELTIYKGRPVRDLPPDATRHDGYIITFPDGRLHIVDKRELKLSEITGKEEDGSVVLKLRGGGDITDIQRFKDAMAEAKASEVPTLLIVHHGKIEWANDNGSDERRLLFELADGTFGVISTITGGKAMGINDILVLLSRIAEKHGGTTNAVYLDTGHYDYTSYYRYEQGGRERVVIGHPDKTTQMCRLFFIQDKGTKKDK